MELDLVELQRFWRLPVEYFFKRRLKVSFEPPLAVLEDDEPFALDGLSAYQLRDELVENLLACRDGAERDQVVAQFAKQQRAQGKLLWQRLAILNWRKVRSKLWRWRKKLAFCVTNHWKMKRLIYAYSPLTMAEKSYYVVGS